MRMSFPTTFFSFVCKPGSVLNGHQSARSVTGNASRGIPCATPSICRTNAWWGVASDRVYSGSALPQKRVSSYLAFPSLPHARRFISVALSRRLPVADVISYPVLRSPDFPHGNTLRQHTARPSGEAVLLLYRKNFCLSIDFLTFSSNLRTDYAKDSTFSFLQLDSFVWYTIVAKMNGRRFL